MPGIVLGSEDVTVNKGERSLFSQSLHSILNCRTHTEVSQRPWEMETMQNKYPRFLNWWSKYMAFKVQWILLLYFEIKILQQKHFFLKLQCTYLKYTKFWHTHTHPVKFKITDIYIYITSPTPRFFMPLGDPSNHPTSGNLWSDFCHYRLVGLFKKRICVAPFTRHIDLRFIYAIVCINHSFLFDCWIVFHGDDHLGCFQFGAITNRAA